MCCKRPSRREPSNFTMVHRYWSMCHLPFAISQLPTPIKKSCWPSFSGGRLLARQDLPTPVEKKPLLIGFSEATGLWIRRPAANSHFPLPKSEDFLAFLKDWRPSWLLGTAGERKCLTLSHDDIYVGLGSSTFIKQY